MNNQPQQNYQQPQYQQPQPQYQPPQYQQPYYPPKPPKDFSAMINKVSSVLTIVFLCIGAVAFVYGLVMSIVGAASDKVYLFTSWQASQGFGEFVAGIAWTVSISAKYFFFAGVLAGIQKLLKK